MYGSRLEFRKKTGFVLRVVRPETRIHHVRQRLHLNEAGGTHDGCVTEGTASCEKTKNAGRHCHGRKHNLAAPALADTHKNLPDRHTQNSVLLFAGTVLCGLPHLSFSSRRNPESIGAPQLVTYF